MCILHADISIIFLFILCVQFGNILTFAAGITYEIGPKSNETGFIILHMIITAGNFSHVATF